eukprot:151033-Prymnesium_polylepis.1
MAGARDAPSLRGGLLDRPGCARVWPRALVSRTRRAAAAAGPLCRGHAPSSRRHRDRATLRGANPP